MQQVTNYLVPSGDGKSQIAIDLAEIAKAEGRLQDVAIVNQDTAPEMLATFNDVWLKLNRSVTLLTCEKNKAENLHKRSRSEAKINCTDEVIKAKGHSKASADLREAIVELDPEVIRTKERLDEIEFVRDILRGKQQAFYNAYDSVKKLTSGKTLPSQHFGDGNRPAPFSQPPPQVTSQQLQDPDLEPLPQGFVTPRY